MCCNSESAEQCKLWEKGLWALNFLSLPIVHEYGMVADSAGGELRYIGVGCLEITDILAIIRGLSIDNYRQGQNSHWPRIHGVDLKLG